MPVKTFLINKTNSERFRLNGLVPSACLPNKRQLCQNFCDHMVYSAEQLPPKVDFRADMTPVEDQSKIGSCAANCFAGAYEYLTKKANGRNTDVSRLFIYYNARRKDQKSDTVVDSGCTMTSAIEALEEFGTCLESLWPYDISRVNERPNPQAYKEAQRHKITEALRIDIDLNEMKSCLAQGFPFAFGIRLFTSFDQAARTGVVPMPNIRDNRRSTQANHALLAVGYSDQSRAFIVRNSWGEHWGDQGYCYIPYDYVANSNLTFDVWTIRKLALDDFSRDHWDRYDRVNYIPNKVGAFNNNADDNSRVIETINDDDYNRNGNNECNLWNEYRIYGADNYAQKKGYHRNQFDRYPGNGNFYYDQFREKDNYSGRRGGYADFDQYQNNNPIFFYQPLPPQPSFNGPQQYGLNYGYGSHFDPFL